MSIRSKTKKRLLILLVALAVVGGVVTWVTMARMAEVRRSIERARVDGMAAAKAGDHVKALNLLSRYLRDHKNDVDALYDYAVARREIPAPQGKNFLEAMGLFRAVLQLQPDHAKAQKDLLQIYNLVRYNVEAIELADQYLAKNPNDAEVLRYKAVAQLQSRKFDDAYKTAAKAVAADPDNMQGQMMVLQIMRALDKQPQDIIAYGQNLQKKWDNDEKQGPKGRMLLGYAYFLARDYGAATDWLLKAAAGKSPDAEFVRVLSMQLDTLARFHESMELLKRNVDESGDPTLARMLVRRYWELFRYDEMLALLDKLDLDSPKSHSELMAFKAMALIRTGREADARKVMEVMLARGDQQALAWVRVLREVVLPKTQDVKKVIEACQTALTSDPANPYIRFFLGEAFFQIGENELALDQWKIAVTPDKGGSSTWALPWVRMSQAFAGTNRTKQAFEAAANAVRRAPTNSAAISALATAQSELIEQAGVKERSKDLLELLTQIQRAAPGEAQTLPLYIELMAKNNRNDEAVMTILDTIAEGGQLVQFGFDADAAFKALDANNDGSLTREEFVKAAGGVYLETAQRRFKAVDAKGEGKLAVAAFKALCPGESDVQPKTADGKPVIDEKTKKPVESPVVTHFNNVDKDHDGFVTFDEWLADLREALFRHADADNDGKLTKAEFTANATSETLLVHLAAISRQYKLGVEEFCYTASEKRWGMTPNLAYARAMILETEKAKGSGREYFEKLYKPEHEKELTWQTAWAQLMTSTGDPSATELWVKLADSNTENLSLQRRALNAVQDNRQFADRVIDRIRNLGGEAGLTWRLARARWLLGSEDGQKDAAKAVVILNEIVRVSPDLIEPRLLLAAALQKVDNVSGAIDQLTAAYNLQPKNEMIMLALARMKMAQGDYAQTRRLLEQILNDATTNDAMKRQVAVMLAQIGDTPEAVKLLANNTKADQPDLMLAELYFRSNQRDKAEAMYKKLMEKPDAMTIQSYATFLGTADRIEDANSVLRQLDNVKIGPGIASMIRAEFNRRFVSLDAAVREYENAISAAPTEVVPYVNMMSLYIERQKIDEAIAVNARAVKAVPDNKLFNLIASNGDLLKSVASKPQLQRLVQSVLSDTEHREAAVEILRTIDKAAKDKDPVLPTLAKLRLQADKYPKFLPLQILMVDLYAGAGRLEDAAALATRAMQTFPNNPEPAEQATRVMAAMRRWNEVLTMASQWRERSLAKPLAADIAMAEAYINTGDGAKAIQQVAPYRTQALADPNNFFGVISVNVRALAVSGKYDEASTILKPLLTGPQGWRDFWQIVAMQWIGPKDAKTAAAWLERLDPVIPPNSQEEFHALATNWYNLGRRANNAQWRQHGIDMVKNLAQRDDALPGAMIGYAILAYQEKDIVTAEAQYRKALAKKPDHPVALNNLAMLIVERNGDLDEALKFAKKCVEVDSANANYYDTLASVQAKRKDYAAAVASLRQALQIQPSNIEWRISLAQAHMEQGKAAEARDVLKEIDSLQPRLDTLPADQQKRIRDLRAAVVKANSEDKPKAKTSDAGKATQNTAATTDKAAAAP
jgi:tetratricopeptide (TPR) repeat protein